MAVGRAARLENGEITKDQYYEWQYKYPDLDTHQIWAKVPSQGLSNMLLEEYKKLEKEEKETNKKKNKDKHKKDLTDIQFFSEN